MKAYVYILKSERNGRYYIGSTNNLERRLKEHNNGEAKATKYIGPLKLVYSEEYKDLNEARRRERKLKSYKSRKVLEKIMGL